MSETFTDWHWQFANRINDLKKLGEHISLSDDEIKGIEESSKLFRWSVTPYYTSLMSKKDSDCPIRKQALPSLMELEDDEGEHDPLDEEKNSPVEGLIHAYPDRVAFVVTGECAMFCRHCTRRRKVGKVDTHLSRASLIKGIEYIRENPEIRDVLITGGDPLVASDEWIEWLVSQVRAIPHVEIIRIGTRVPCTMPQRITDKLCDMLSKYHPIWLNTQFNHPRELTEEAAKACDRLLCAGIPVGNQSVLLKGINDDSETMKALVHGLVKMRVRPYYLYQCEVVKGTRHFRTPMEKGLDIIRHLQGYTTGFAVPTFILDTPIGKVPVSSQNVVARDDEYVTLRNYEGKIYKLKNPKEGWR